MANRALGRRAFLGASFGATAATLLAVACGPAATPTPAAKPATSAPATSPPAADAKPAAAPTNTTAPAKPAESTKPAAATEAAKPAAAAPAGPLAPATLKMSVWGTVNDKAVYDKIIDDFQKANPGVRITGEQWVQAYYDKMQVEVAAGTAPDVLYFEPFNWQRFAATGVTEPLEAYRQADNFNHPWPDLPMYKEYTTWRGKLYHMPTEAGSQLMFYNKDVFDNAGVPYPKKDWTVDDMFDIARKLTKPDQKIFGLSHPFLHYIVEFPWWRSHGVTEFDTILEPRKANFTDPVIEETMERYLVQAIKSKLTPDPAAMRGPTTGFQHGGVGMMDTFEWFLPTIKSETKPIRFDVTLMPRGKSGKSAHFVSAGPGHQINAKSPRKDHAWAVLKWLGSDEGQKRVAEGGRQCGTPAMSRKHWVEQTRKNFGVESAEMFTETYETGHAPMINAIGVAPMWDKALKPSWDAMADGMPAKQALATANVEAQKLLDEYWVNFK